MKKFDLGQVVMTQGVMSLIEKEPLLEIEIGSSLYSHCINEWGNLCEEDKKANDYAVEHGEKILSAYEIGENKIKIWIITEWDRSYTTILLPEEY